MPPNGLNAFFLLSVSLEVANGLSGFAAWGKPELLAPPKPNGLPVFVAGLLANGLLIGVDELCVGCPNDENIWFDDATAVALI